MLPDVAEQLTADFLTAAVLILQEALGGGEDSDAEAVEDARNLGVAVIETAAGRGDASETRESATEMSMSSARSSRRWSA